MRREVQDFVDQAYGLCDESRVAVEIFQSTTTEAVIIEFLDVNKEEARLISILATLHRLPRLSWEYEAKLLTVKLSFDL